MKLCPKCQKQFSDDANFCPVDAARLTPLDSAAASSASASDSLAARFELGAKLGGSRTGTVFRATDKQTKQAVAVKVVAPAVLALPGVAQRLDRELKQLERVTSASVAKVIASGKRSSPAGEETWIAMELLDGAQTLAEAISARGPIPANQAADLIEVIGEALIEAAQVGVVHRDLASKNVLLANQELKLINFPLPVPTDKVAGVPEVVAPEQIDGKPVDQRSNLYNLGALYYYVLTGQPIVSGSVDDMHKAHAAGAIRPPTTLVPTIPSAVEAIIVRALDRSPTKRFLTVRQFVDEVSRVASGGADMRSTMPMGKMNKPRGEIVQTLLGMKLGVNGAVGSAPVVAPIPAPIPAAPSQPVPAAAIASAPTVGGVPVLSPQVGSAPIAPAAQGVAGTMIGVSSGNQAPAPNSIWAPPAGVGGPAAPVAQAAPVAAPVPAPVPVPVPAPAPVPVPAPAPVPVTFTGPPPAAPVIATATPVGPPMPVAAASIPAQPIVAPAAPVVAAPVIAASPAGKKKTQPADDGSKGKFRETLWFKKGELDAAAAELAAAEAAKGKDVSDKADQLPIDDRYKDDGTVSRSDKEKYSLRTGATQMMSAVKDQPPGTSGQIGKVSDDALIGEMKSGRTAVLIAIALAALVIVGLVILFTRS